MNEHNDKRFRKELKSEANAAALLHSLAADTEIEPEKGERNIYDPIAGPSIPQVQPTRYVPLRQSGPEAPASLAVWRMSLAELALVEEWLLPQLEKLWPVLNRRQISSYLRSTISSNTMYLIRTDNSVGLVELIKNHDQTMFSSEIFVLTKPDAPQDTLLIYRKFLDWSKSLRAAYLLVDTPTDILTQVMPDREVSLYQRTKIK